MSILFCEADVKTNAKPMSRLMRSRCQDTAKPMFEFAAKSKTVHAIMFINQIRSCMNHICAKKCEADVKINAKPMSRYCEADVKVNAKPMSG